MPEKAVSLVDLTVTAAGADSQADIELRFAFPEQQIEFPKFERTTSNPVIMAFLEYDVLQMSSITGGGELYFRNRILHSLANAKPVDNFQVAYRGSQVAATLIEFRPFEDAPLRDRMEPVFHAKVYRMWLSDAVPGFVAMIQTSAGQDGAAGGRQFTENTLKLENAQLH